MRKTLADPFVGVMMAVACACTPDFVPAAEWAYLPPRDADPKAATLDNPIPRRWSGQKAALAFSHVEKSSGRVMLSWADAAAARQAPKLRGDPRSLWKGRFPDKPPVTEPHFYAMAKDGRLFRDTLPAATVLLPFVVVVDGNPEDGYGGYVLGCVDGDWSYEQKDDMLAVSGKDAFAFTFDGTWLAGLQCGAGESAALCQDGRDVVRPVGDGRLGVGAGRREVELLGGRMERLPSASVRFACGAAGRSAPTGHA